MATAKQFFQTLKDQKLVSNEVLKKLAAQYRASGGTVTAEAMAAQLVSTDDLSEDQVARLLQSASDSVVMSDAFEMPSSEEELAAADPYDESAEAESADFVGDGGEIEAGGRRKHVKKTHKNDFDSPLLLIGGGVLALLLLGGAGLMFVMNLQSGDQLIESAQSAYAKGSYSVARDDYKQFVEDFSGNPRWSEARVALTVVRLRQAIESNGNWSQALSIAKEEIPQIEDEQAFAESRGEFASLLPRVARGLAEEADALSSNGGEGDQVAELVTSAGEALTFVGNTKYVPKSLRDDTAVAEIRELLDRVERRREAEADLVETLVKIDAAVSDGKVSDAYAAQSAFVRRRPELRDESRLADKLAVAVESERQVVRFTAAQTAAETDERSLPLALALANPRRAGEASAEGVFTGVFGGAMYAFNAADGGLLWRLPVGTRLADTPATAIDTDLLVVDHRNSELRRLVAATGKLVWRVSLESTGAESAFFKPVVAGRRVLVASESGQLWSVDSTTGERQGYVNFAQPLRAAPAVDESRGKVYVNGEQSSLYTLDIDSLECLAVYYTGHSAGSVPAAPLVVGGRVITLQNTGAETAQLNLYATDNDGLVTSQLRDWRLEGVVSTLPTVSGRRVLVATESGAVYLFEVTATQDGQPLVLVASRAPVGGASRPRRAVEARGDVWIAGEGLRRTAASLADSQLVSRALPNPCDDDVFFGPFEPRGGALLHARRRRDQPGATFGATDSRTGKLIWETDVAIPPMGPPAVSTSPRGLVATNLVGQTHLLGSRAIRTRLSAEPTTAPTRDRRFDAVVRTDDGVIVATTVGSSEWTAMRPGSGARGVSLPGELACEPAVLGKAIVTPLRVGQVHLLDATGGQAALPFQPLVVAGQSIEWTPPAVGTVGGEALVVLSDGRENVYCLAVSSGASPALEPRGNHKLSGAQPVTAAAIAGDAAAIGLEGAQMAVYDLPSMSNPQFITVPGELVWGPYPAGEVVLAATEGRLFAVSLSGKATIAWEVELSAGRPVGKPLTDGSTVILVSGDGELTQRSLSDGAIESTIDLGQRVASGATAYGPRLLVSAADGSVLVINKP